MQLFIGQINGNTALLSDEEARHFTKVLRGKPGQIINVIDGSGKMGTGEVSLISTHSVEIKLDSVIENFEKRNYHLHIAVSPTKNMDRTEFLIEKAVEIGVDEISFVLTFHSERKKINIERISKIVASSVKQSLKAYFPKINHLMKFNDFILQNSEMQKLIAHCDTDFERAHFQSLAKPETDYLILIGPEGDFSKEEITLAEKKGFIGISLGNQRLRTETAALNAVFGINWVNQLK